MTEKKFSTSWVSSKNPNKQRKYRFNAPLHVKQKMMHVHLSSELRKKHGARNVQLRVGDKVKVMRGQFAKKEGKVERIQLKRERVYITGIEIIKKDGTKLLAHFHPSNLMITVLELGDKIRKTKLEPAPASEASKTKPTKSKVTK